jgi:hypothetical protein
MQHTHGKATIPNTIYRPQSNLNSNQNRLAVSVSSPNLEATNPFQQLSSVDEELYKFPQRYSPLQLGDG